MRGLALESELGGRVGEEILRCIGGTPLLRLRRWRPANARVEVLLKAEWFNPGGSVKDRPALAMIEAAERRGELRPDKILIDSTSGNTGIAYALIGAAKGYRVRLVMPANVNEERKKLVQAYGAEVVYSDPLEGSDGAYRLCHELLERDPDLYYYPAQYDNPVNWQAHYETTGVEIWEQTQGEVTHFVAGMGTTGTLVGTGRRLKDYCPRIQVVGVQPDGPLHGLEGLKHLASSLRPQIYDPSVPDALIEVRTEDAYRMCLELARREGILVGYSAGAAFWAAMQLAERISRGVIVAMMPDGGTRYLSELHLLEKEGGSGRRCARPG